MPIGIGQITISDVHDGALIESQYAANTSETTAPTTGWSASVPAPQTGYYVWKQERTKYADGSTSAWSAAIRVTGSKGNTGSTGPKGDTGSQGPQGVQGPAGADGSSLFTWVAYANDASGNGISASPTGKAYIGFAYNKTTSTMTLTPGLFTWAKIEGPQGTTGATGATLYTWLKYADTPTTGMSDSPTGKTYIGLAYNKTTSTESTNYGDYTWSLIKGDKGDTGAQGAQGPQGIQGPTGQTGAQGPAGTPALTALLTNDSHTVPTDKDGNNGNYAGCITTMKIYSGTTDDSANWTVTASAPNITGSLSGKTYTVTAMSVDTGYVDLTATGELAKSV